MEFAYVAWGSGAIAARAFRALAVISASNELAGALAAAAVFSILLLAVGAAFNLSAASVTAPLKLMLAALLAGGILLAPSRVIVEERFDGQDLLWPATAGTAGVMVVDAVPFGVALPAALGSALAVALTRVVETAMLLVDAEDRLSSAGLWLNARALRAMVEPGVVHDPTLLADFRYFLQNCTYFDVLAQRAALERLAHTPPRAELALTAGSVTSLPDSAGQLVALSCPQAWSGAAVDGRTVTGLQDRIAAEAERRKLRACQSLRGIALAAAPTLPAGVGTPTACGDSVFAHAMGVFGYRGSVADQFRELVAIELLRAGSFALSSQDPHTVAFARFIAERSRNAAFVVAAELAAVALPALRGLLEAIVLVLTPILLVLGVLFFDQLARYLKTGFVLILWLQLWPPIMAVVNSVGQWVQVAALRSHAQVDGGNFTAAGVDALLAELDTQLALARYLLVMVPVLAWALVRAGEFSGALLAGRLLQPGEQAAAGVSSHVARNDWSADQVNLAPRTTLGPHAATLGDAWGATTTRYPQASTVELPANAPGYVAATQSRTLTAALRQRAEDARVETQEKRSQLASSVESLYSEAFGEEGRETLNALREEKVTDSTALRALDSTGQLIRQAVTRGRAVEQHSATEHTWRTGVEGGIGSGFLPLPVTLGGKLSTTQDQDVGLSEQMRRGYDLLSDKSKSALNEVGTALERADTAAASTSYAQVASNAYQAKLSEALQQQESYVSAQQQAQRLTQASELASSTSSTVVQELLKDPRQAALLGQFHQLYQVQGLPFEQAWTKAQQASGVELDVEQLAGRLLSGDVPAVAPEQGRAAVAQDHAANRAKVAAAPPRAAEQAPEFAQAEQRLRAARQQAQQPLAEPGEEFYQDSRAFDKTVRDGDGEVIVIPDKSLYRAGDKRLTEVWKSIGDGDE